LSAAGESAVQAVLDALAGLERALILVTGPEGPYGEHAPDLLRAGLALLRILDGLGLVGREVGFHPLGDAELSLLARWGSRLEHDLGEDLGDLAYLWSDLG
jgi:hypothetical protein